MKYLQILNLILRYKKMLYTLILFLEKKWGIHYSMGGTGSVVKAMEKLIAKVEADGIFAKKPLGFKKSKRKLLEKSEKEIDKFLKPYENKVSPKRLSAVKKYFIARQIQEVAKQNKKNQESAKNIAQKEKIDREDNKITSNKII